MADTIPGQLLTERLRRQQIALRAQFLRELHKVWPLLDPVRLDATAASWLSLVLDLVIGFRTQSATLSLVYYDKFRSAETGLPAFHADHLADLIRPNLDAIRTSLIVTGPVKIKHDTALGRDLKDIGRQALVSVSGAASRHVLNGGRDAIDTAVASDTRSVGFVRTLGPKPCYFCAMLASRGPVYLTEETALRTTVRSERGPGQKYHDNCMCGAEPMFRRLAKQDWPDETRELNQMWKDAKKGHSGKAVVNAFRQAFEARQAAIPTQRTGR
jgi:hypothetical protein